MSISTRCMIQGQPELAQLKSNLGRECSWRKYKQNMHAIRAIPISSQSPTLRTGSVENEMMERWKKFQSLCYHNVFETVPEAVNKFQSANYKAAIQRFR